MDFALTDAGRAAIADAANVGLNKVTLTKLAVGDGRGAVDVGDSGRTTLRNERMRSAVAGTDPGAARIAVRARFMGAPGASTWNVTEVGLIARIGATGAEFLFAYGAELPGADPVAAIAAGVSTTVPVDLAIVAAADINVTVAPDISVTGATAFSALTDTPAALVAGRYYRANAAADALEGAAASAVLSDLLGAIPAGNYLRVRDIGGGVRGLEGRTLAQVAAEITTRWNLRNNVVFSPSVQRVGRIATLTVPAGAVCSGILTFERTGASSGALAWAKPGWTVDSPPADLFYQLQFRNTQIGTHSVPVQFRLPAGTTQIALHATSTVQNVTLLGPETYTFLVATLI